MLPTETQVIAMLANATTVEERRLVKLRYFGVLYGMGERRMNDVVQRSAKILSDRIELAGWTRQRLGQRSSALRKDLPHATLLAVEYSSRWPLHQPYGESVPVLVFICERETLRILATTRIASLDVLLREGIFSAEQGLEWLRDAPAPVETKTSISVDRRQ